MKIWIIDDDDIFKYITTYQLMKIAPGCNLEMYENPLMALDELKVAKDLPNYLFLDINFPDLKGWYFLEHFDKVLKESERKKISIYMISSSISKSDSETLLKYGFVKGLLQKPIKDEVFDAILNPAEWKSGN